MMTFSETVARTISLVRELYSPSGQLDEGNIRAQARFVIRKDGTAPTQKLVEPVVDAAWRSIYSGFAASEG